MASYRYDENSRLMLKNTPAGATRYEYCDAGLIASLSNANRAGETLSSYSYEYGLDGNQTSKTENTIARIATICLK